MQYLWNGPVTDRRITGFLKDQEGDWVAELECRHFQHVRHNPPWTNRPWVLAADTRASALGGMLNCRKCEDGDPPDRDA